MDVQKHVTQIVLLSQWRELGKFLGKMAFTKQNEGS